MLIVGGWKGYFSCIEAKSPDSEGNRWLYTVYVAGYAPDGMRRNAGLGSRKTWSWMIIKKIK